MAVGRGIWMVLNGTLIKSAALWTANTAKVIANRVAQFANNAGVKLWIQLAGMKIAALWKSTVAWAKETAAMVAQKTALVASTVATKAATIAQKALNVAMRMSPLGWVVTAITAVVGALVWFFTQTETGKKIWAGFMTFLSEAWTNIVAFAKTIWEGLSSFFTGLWDGIKAVFTTVIESVVSFVRDHWGMLLSLLVGPMGLAIQWIVENWGAIKQFFANVWNAIVGYVTQKVAQVRAVIVAVTTVIRSVWANVWGGIKAFFTGVWAFLVAHVQSRIELFKQIISLGINFIRSIWTNVWNGIKTVLSNVWNGIKNTITTMINFIRTKPKAAFEAARDAIGKAWSGIKDLAKKPVVFVVDTVINGMIRAINKFLPKKWELSEVKLPKGFHDGGYTGNLHERAIAGVVHGDEHVIRAASRRAIEARHPGLLDHMNRYGEVPGFRKGGYVNPLPRGSYTISQPFHAGHNGIDLAAPTGTKIMAAAPGTVTHAGWHTGGGGNQVNLRHAGGIVTWYAHMSKVLTKVGEQVQQGQVIGRVGSTGNSTGPHLHYMVMPGGWPNYINPAPYMTGSTTPKGGGGAVEAADGLMGWVSKQLSKAGSGVWGNVGAGLAMSVAENVVKFIKSKIPVDVGSATLYDNGGLLQPGLSLVANKTNRPEPILTNAQWDAVMNSNRGSMDGSRFSLVLDNGERLTGFIREVADDAIDDAAEDTRRSHRFAAI